jgi:hypothetical protein
VILNSQRSKNQTNIENLTFVRQRVEVTDLHHAVMANRRSEGAGNIERTGPARLDSHLDVSGILETWEFPSGLSSFELFELLNL